MSRFPPKSRERPTIVSPALTEADRICAQGSSVPENTDHSAKIDVRRMVESKSPDAISVAILNNADGNLPPLLWWRLPEESWTLRNTITRPGATPDLSRAMISAKPLPQ